MDMYPVLTKMLRQYYNDDTLMFDFDQDYHKIPPKDRMYQDKVVLKRNGQTLYRICFNHYPTCCGAGNLSDLYSFDVRSSQKHERLSSVFVMLALMYAKLKSDINLITLTIPQRSSYAKSKIIIDRIGKVFPKTTTVFTNSNTGHIIDHICINMDELPVSLRRDMIYSTERYDHYYTFFKAKFDQLKLTNF